MNLNHISQIRPILFGTLLTAMVGSANAAVIITVSDKTPNGDNGSGARLLTTDFGVVTGNPTIPTTTYSVGNLDLTSVGGGASETIAFNVTYSQTGGTGVQFNGFGNVSVTGGDNNQVDVDEALTATLTINNGLTTFNTANITLGFRGIVIGGFGGAEKADVTHEGGTIDKDGANQIVSFPSSSFVTLAPTNGASNLQQFTVEITAVPEPSAALLGGIGVLALLRRRR